MSRILLNRKDAEYLITPTYDFNNNLDSVCFHCLSSGKMFSLPHLDSEGTQQLIEFFNWYAKKLDEQTYGKNV